MAKPNKTNETGVNVTDFINSFVEKEQKSRQLSINRAYERMVWI